MSNLPTDYQKFIHLSRYARWLGDLEVPRRETWNETVTRYLNFLEGHLLDKFNYKMPDRKRLENAILTLQIMPSMRALMTAGPALEKDNISGYNCSYIPVDSPRAFDEILYVLMCGTGVGFSCERRHVEKLSVVNERFEETETTIIVQDSKAGWARGLRELIAFLYAGQLPKWDLSRLRPAGARLKTFGGRSSGPAPLDELFTFTVSLFKDNIRKIQNFIYWHYINGSAYNTPFWKKASKYKIKDKEFHSILSSVKKHSTWKSIEQTNRLYGQWLPVSFKIWQDGIHVQKR